MQRNAEIGLFTEPSILMAVYGSLLDAMITFRSQRQGISNPAFICRLLLFWFVFSAVFLIHSVGCATDLKEEKRVLILFPSQTDLPAYPLVEKGIKSSLAVGTEFHIEYFIEHMDYYRNADQTYNQLLLDLYHYKFSKHKIDLVIAYSAPSLSLVIDHCNDLFPQTPIVFSGILGEQLKKLNLNPMVTGVLVDIDYAGMLETALKIHPQTRHVAIVNGASKTDLLLEKEFRTALQPYTEQVDLIYLTRLPLDKILQKIQQLPEHSVILYYLLSRDGDGKGFPPWEVAAILAESATSPVYGCLDSYFGHGIVGGRMISLEMTGVKAGEMALRILRGAKPSDIPLTSQGTVVDLFDWRQFKRFDIREERLPPGSTVRFKTYSFWELHRGYIVAALLLIALQGGLISFLLRQRAQRQRAQTQLAERLRFEEMLSALSARFVNITPDRVDAEIGHVLESIGKSLDVDRVSVFELSEKDQTLRLVHAHRDTGIAAPPSEIQLKQIPWVTQKLVDGETLALSTPDDLPDEAIADRHFLRSHNTVSLLVIPLSTGEKPLGLLSLGTLRHPKMWPEEVIRQCRLVAEVFANALVRKQHEDSLMRAEAKYRTVADFTYDWEYWVNVEHSLEYVSPSCERISGYKTQDFMENPSLFTDIILPEDRGVWDGHYQDARQRQKPREIQFRIVRRDGQIRWLEHNCQPVTDRDGHLQGFRVSNRDITARKEVEKGIREREKDLQRLATRLISAQEEERQRLARELHDDLSQRLAVLAIQAGSMEQQAVNKDVLDAEACSLLKDRLIAISNDVHSLSRQLHPSILDDLGLKRAVESECARFSNREGIAVAFSAENIPGALPKDVSLSIYRIIQEGLNNIAKHACARRAEIALKRTDGELSLSIQDDGIGFDAAEVRQKPGLGLSSMRERVRIIHGVLRIMSEPGKGTTIRVRVPVEKSSTTEATATDPE